jgi:cysteine synthase
MGMEIAEDLPDADVVLVPVGGGSLISGTLVALRALRPDMEIIGVQAERADALARSLEQGALRMIGGEGDCHDGLKTDDPTRQIGAHFLADRHRGSLEVDTMTFSGYPHHGHHAVGDCGSDQIRR